MRNEVVRAWSLSSAGNGMLEMLLFLPLGLMVLFVGTDTGISMIDKAMLRDMVREGGHFQVPGEADEVFSVNSTGRTINDSAVDALVNDIGSRMTQVVQERRIVFGMSNASASVQVRALRLIIDPEDGSVMRYESFSSQFSSTPGFDLRQYSDLRGYISPEEYLQQELGMPGETTKFGIASPILDSQNRYLPENIAFLVTVEAVTPSLSPSWQQMVLGSRAGFQVHQLKVIRN
jgi:hypothetical protein